MAEQTQLRSWEDGAECFALPREEKMSFDAFLALLADKHASKVVYAQAQNDSLRQEFASLLPDIDADSGLGSQDIWAAARCREPVDRRFTFCDHLSQGFLRKRLLCGFWQQDLHPVAAL